MTTNNPICTRKPPAREAGSIIIMVVGLLVVLATAGVGLLTQQANSRISALEQGFASAAKNAANSGAGYALNQLFYPDKSLAQADAACTALTASISFTAAGLSGCTASLSCASSWVSGSTEHNYTVVAIGQCGSGSSLVRRRTTVAASR